MVWPPACPACVPGAVRPGTARRADPRERCSAHRGSLPAPDSRELSGTATTPVQPVLRSPAAIALTVMSSARRRSGSSEPDLCLPEQFDLEVVDRPKIVGTHREGPPAGAASLRSAGFACQIEDLGDRTGVLLGDLLEDRMQSRLDERLHIHPGDIHVSLRKGHLDVADKGSEERPFCVHLVESLVPRHHRARPRARIRRRTNPG